jgi:hypothetical protein
MVDEARDLTAPDAQYKRDEKGQALESPFNVACVETESLVELRLTIWISA